MKKLAALALLGFMFACSSHAGSNSQSAASPAASPAAASSAGAMQNAAMQKAAMPAAALRPSTMTFKEAGAACTGALGSITFAMGHVRAHAATGVDLNELPESSSGIGTITFTDKASGKTATVSVNAHNRSVNGKHVTVKRSQSVACIGAE